MVGIIAVVLCCMFLAVSCAKSSFQSPFHKTKTAQEMAERPTLELHTGAFQSGFWVEDTAAEVEPQFTTKFVVALKLRNVQQMHDDLMEISHPRSKRYGQYMNLQELQERFGPTKDERERVANFFSSMPGAQVKLADLGDMLEVTATVASIEQHLDTKLSWHQHEMMQIEKRSLRANKEIKIPQDVAEAISFVSLNSPINHMFPRASKLLKEEQEKIFNLDFSRPKEGAFLATPKIKASIGIVSGNEGLTAIFQPFCGDNTVNNANPPCSNKELWNQPTVYFSITTHANDRNNPYQLDTVPMVFEVSQDEIYCYEQGSTMKACNGNQKKACNCIAKISPLPKYVQLRVNVTEKFPHSDDPDAIHELGISNLIALTNVATVPWLSKLYNMPVGQTVRHGANQSVVEFYEQYYSNSDLDKFLEWTGMKSAQIPDENVRGDLPNDDTKTGGEAQLDIEYLMGLAPEAATYFYSFSDLNPYSPINEGFLAYLLYVNSETDSPLVHSLSYGDIEASVFNTSINGSIQYGERCEQEFLKLGLRGISLIFSSGDDGVGSNMVQKDPKRACGQTWPTWPAGSPYVTTVGATMMTDKHLPACLEPYAFYTAPGYLKEIPPQTELRFRCNYNAETVCTSAFGGLITSGGGFSAIADRSKLAPWQDSVVSEYLASHNSDAYPPTSYFNKKGRGYPDVATYGSQFFVYLNGEIIRESGTSASAPVFAAMVTLWNDMRAAYNMPPMGFIAPFLYEAFAKAPEAFQDIRTGDNACGVGRSMETANCCEYAYKASPGWDAVSGLGSPNFKLLSSLVLNMDSQFPDLGAYPTASAKTTTMDDSPTTILAVDTNSIAVAGLVFGILAFLLAAYAVCCQKKHNYDAILDTSSRGNRN